jgi:hypothetical protein
MKKVFFPIIIIITTIIIIILPSFSYHPYIMFYSNIAILGGTTHFQTHPYPKTVYFRFMHMRESKTLTRTMKGCISGAPTSCDN